MLRKLALLSLLFSLPCLLNAQPSSTTKARVNELLIQFQAAVNADSFKLIEPLLSSTFQISSVPPGAASKALLLGMMHCHKLQLNSFKIKNLTVHTDTINAKIQFVVNHKQKKVESFRLINQSNSVQISYQEGRLLDLLQDFDKTKHSSSISFSITKAEYKAFISDSIPIGQVNKVINGDTINKVNEAGNPQGKWNRSYSNGAFMCEGEYVNGKKEGYWHKNFENGKPMYEAYFHEGVLHGASKNYYDNGQVKDDGLYINGKPDGVLKKYYVNGQLAAEETYKNGVLIGPNRYFDEHGKQLKAKKKRK